MNSYKTLLGFLLILSMLALPSIASAKYVPRQINVVGDSLTVGAKPYLTAPGYRLNVSARVGRPTNEGLAVLRRMPKTKIIVLGLGTNDGANDVRRTMAMVNTGYAYVGTRGCVITYTLHNNNRAHGRQNQWLRTKARTNKKLVLVDWEAAIRANPDYLAGDGVHGTTRGYQARGKLTSLAIAECRRLTSS